MGTDMAIGGGKQFRFGVVLRGENVRRRVPGEQELCAQHGKGQPYREMTPTAGRGGLWPTPFGRGEVSGRCRAHARAVIMRMMAIAVAQSARLVTIAGPLGQSRYRLAARPIR